MFQDGGHKPEVAFRGRFQRRSRRFSIDSRCSRLLPTISAIFQDGGRLPEVVFLCSFLRLGRYFMTDSRCPGHGYNRGVLLTEACTGEMGHGADLDAGDIGGRR